MSLKDILHNLIKERGEVSYGELCQITVEQEYKVGTMERRLRDLTTKSNGHIPDVKPVLSIGKRRGGKYISGYKWIGEYKKTDFQELARLASEIKDYTKQEQGLFVYKVDPKHAISELRDPN